MQRFNAIWLDKELFGHRPGSIQLLGTFTLTPCHGAAGTQEPDQLPKRKSKQGALCELLPGQEAKRESSIQTPKSGLTDHMHRALCSTSKFVCSILPPTGTLHACVNHASSDISPCMLHAAGHTLQVTD
jgi:hypothetical protein